MDIFSKILKIQNFFPENCVFCEFGLPGQTQRHTTIKIDMHLPEGLPYGHFFENFENSKFFPKKLRCLRILTLKNYDNLTKKLVQHPGQTVRPTIIKNCFDFEKHGSPKNVWYYAQTKPNGL